MSVSISKSASTWPVAGDRRIFTSSSELNDRIHSLILFGGAYLMESEDLRVDAMEKAKTIRESACLPVDWEDSVEILRQDRQR